MSAWSNLKCSAFHIHIIIRPRLTKITRLLHDDAFVFEMLCSQFFLFTRKTKVDVFKFLRVEERIIADVRPNRRNKTELFSKFSDVLWTRLITHLNNMVKGIPKFPRMAWRYGGVLDPLHAKTIIAPFNALQKPIKNSRN